MTRGLSIRERAARTIAVALVVWVTSRIAVALGLLVSGFATLSADPAVAGLIERYGTLDGHVQGATIGYVGPAGPAESVLRRQMLARYTLAPLLVDASESHRLVLVDLESDAALDAYLERTRARARAHPRPGLAIVERPGSTP